MTESNDPSKLRQEVQARGRGRKSARWKSGLMLTGLGAVVVGAGYLAGVNAPAVSQSAASESVARAGASNSTIGDGQPLTTNSGSNSDEGRVFEFNDEDNEGVPENGGISQFRGDDNSNNRFSQPSGGESGTSGNNQQLDGNNGTSGNQLNQQFGGRRNRQFRGFSQQQPGFGGPVTRSRGS